MAARTLDPKVKGTLVLETVLRDHPLDFLVLFSSITSNIAGVGQVDDCSANAFLDAYSQCASAGKGRLTLTVNWGPWRGDKADERPVEGIGQLPNSIEHIRETYGTTIQEGVDAFARILSTSLSRVVVATQDFQGAINQANSLSTANLLERLATLTANRPTHPRPGLSTAYVGPRNAVEQILAEIWQGLFGIEQVGIHDNFLDLGGHSLLAIQLITRVRDAFQLELPLSILFEAPTVAELAERIIEHRLTKEELEEIEQLYEEIEALPADEVQAQLAQELARISQQSVL